MAEMQKKSPEKKEQKKAPEKKEQNVDTYIMKVTHLSWGFRSRNHFYATKKPEISAKVMGKYASKIDVWLEAGWIEKGSYK